MAARSMASCGAIKLDRAMATAALRYPTTLDEFLPWEERQAERWELVDGRLFLMTGGTIGHDLITRQLANALDRALAGTPCRAHGPNVKVTTPTGAATYPDVFVRCGPIDRTATTTDDPVAIFEVLSPSTVQHDLRRKRRAYETIPSLRFLAFVWPDSLTVWCHARDEAGLWQEGEVEGEEAVLTVPPWGIEIPLRDVYVRTGLLPESEAD